MARKAKPSTPIDPGAIPWLLAVALATAAPHAGNVPPWLALPVGGAIAWRGVSWWKSGALPARWQLALLVVAGVAGIGWEYRTLFGRDAGVALLVFFMALKPMEMRTQRDAIVVVMLGFFLLLTHYFYSQTIPTGFWLLATATLLTATLIRIYGGRQPPLAIARYAGLMLVQALPFMLIAFMLFPRVNGPLWGLPQDAHSGLSGLSERMAPGSLNDLILSGAIAFRVKFEGDVPDQAQRYWRGPVFNDYDGQNWNASRTGQTYQQANQPMQQPPVIEPRGAVFRYVTTLEPHNQRWLLALDMPVTLPKDAVLAPTLETLTRERILSRTRFAFASSVDFVVNRGESEAQLKLARMLPPGLNPRARALAAEWKATFKSPQMISNAALLHFRQEPFRYTLRPPVLGQQAVDEFLFDTRSGFCEHYASAYVFLMRAAGIPARVVAGYQGGEINPVNGYLTVRQSDAHAWAEIWIADRGWIRVDPTAAVAPSRIESGIEAALPASDPLPALIRIDTDWLRDLRNRWEAANNAWNQWVLGYNPERQREVLSRLGLSDPDWRTMTAALAVLGGIALFAVTAWTLFQRNRVTPAQRVWDAFCKRLAGQGLRREPWEGPLAFAARVAEVRPVFGALTREAADLFAALHYGVGTAEQLNRLKECTRRLKTPRLRRTWI
ncbi:MAG: DUF3488 and transglutaminase-like domain-containing protein [Propionivibrio sp.]